MTYPVYKIPTGCTLLNVGKNKTSNHYVLLVKSASSDQDQNTTSTKFAIEFESSRQIEAYLNALNILLKRMKKEGT